VARIWAGRTGTRISVEEEIFSSLKRTDQLCVAPSLVFNLYRGSFPGRIKRPGGTAYHFPPSRAEIKNEWSYTSIPPIYLHSVERDNFTFISQLPFRIFCLKLCKHSSICSMAIGRGKVVKERERWFSQPSGIDTPPPQYLLALEQGCTDFPKI